jgi:hypothetical protein
MTKAVSSAETSLRRGNSTKIQSVKNNGPFNWDADASLFKVFPITARVLLRLNVDAFNVFNHQGLPTPNATDGTVCTTPGGLGRSSANTARQLQLTARPTF